MEKNKLKIAFLLDPSNCWLKPYLLGSNFFKKKNKNIFKLFTSFKKIKNYDFVFILGFTKILKESFLKKNTLNLVVHESKLPKGKGFSPVVWQILEKKKKIPICIFKAETKVDSGKIYFEDQIYFNGTELYDEIRSKQAAATIRILNKFLKNYPKIKSRFQKGKSSYYRKRVPEDAKININTSIKKSFNKLRIGNNESWPSYFYFKKKKYIIKIFKADDKK